MLKTDWISFLFIFIGGGVGSVFRFLLSRFSVLVLINTFPWATLIANILSTMVLAFLVYGFQSKHFFLSEHFKFLLITGFCGGFSTFSTFSYETFELINAGQITLGILNIVLNIVGCLSLIWLSWRLNGALV